MALIAQGRGGAMLRSLEIRDLLIIDHLALDFAPGLNVLTGETGAGKSILLDALGFVLGWRGRAELVRSGADQGEVVAVFDLADDHPARAVLDQAGLPVGDELILRRVNTAEGRKSAWVNDRRASGEVLRALSDTLVELHGQQDDKGLLNPRGHRDLLDSYGKLTAKAVGMRAKWRARMRAARALEQAEAALQAIRAEEDYLRHAAGELSALDPKPGEEGELDARRRMMKAGAKVREDIARAAAALGLEGAEGRMGDAQRWLDGAAAAAEGGLDPALEALARALGALGEAQDGVARVLDALSFDPGELEALEDRLFAIRDLARKHDVLPDDLPELTGQLEDKLAALDAGAGDLRALARAVEDADVAYMLAYATLHEERKKAAGRLDAAMARELAPLRMERAVFTTEVEQDTSDAEGGDRVTFSVATNPGAPAGPLNKIASGGELSRFLLALKVCLSAGKAGATMIFDEIDRGVGGATADAVGRRLAALAAQAQVLVVTHSPQVAALGGHHWRVEKHARAGQTLSRVLPLDAEARVDEIARMLAGDRVTDEARAAARALLQHS